MNPFLFVITSVCIAALIGGLTNYLAIRMLFHPRRPVVIAGRTLPFTPGLIPKRKNEIARSLGKVVTEYLVTSHGISALLRKESFLQSVEAKLKAALRELARREETVEQLCLKLWGEEQWNGLKQSLVGELRHLTEKAVDWLWFEKGWSEATIGDLAAVWTPQAREKLIDEAVHMIIEAVREELNAPNGERLLRILTAQLLEKAGGFLGALAGIFVDEDKLVAKARQALREALASAPVQGALRQFVGGQLKKAEQLRLREAAALLAGDAFLQSPGRWAASRIPAEPELQRLLAMNAEELLGGRLLWFEERLPGLVRLVIRILEQRIDRVMEAMELPALVEAQVTGFPVERLERIILDISGREFRAITWLGALLGGLIGLVQALILQWIG